jgi:hypothetical protein
VQGHHEGVAFVRGAEPLSAFDVVSTGPGRVIVRVLGGRLAISIHRPGTFRVRWLLDDPQPDYGILTEDGDRPDDRGSRLRQRAGHRRRRPVAACAQRATSRSCCARDPSARARARRRAAARTGADRSIDGDLRFPAVARKDGGWLLSFELPTGERVHGLGEKWAALDRAGSASAAGTRTRPTSARSCPTRTRRSRGARRLVVVPPHAIARDARRRLPELVAPHDARPPRGPRARPVHRRARRPRGRHGALHRPHGTREPPAGVELRRVDVARLLRDRRGRDRGRREAPGAAHPLGGAAARRSRVARVGHALRLHLGSGALPRPGGVRRSARRARLPHQPVGVLLPVGAQPDVQRARGARLLPAQPGRHRPTSTAGSRGRSRSTTRGCRRAASSTSPTPTPTRGSATSIVRSSNSASRS